MGRFVTGFVMIGIVSGIQLSSALGQTVLAPTISVSERYDSNVFSTSRAVSSQFKLHDEDYVTSIVPALSVLHKGDHATGFIRGGVSGELYQNNPGLNYVGYNVGGMADLSSSAKRLNPNVGLFVQGNALYSPQIPAFLGASEAALSQNPLIRGIQVTRSNTLAASGMIGSSYRFGPTTSLVGSYGYSRVSFGTEIGPPRSIQLNDTDSHVGAMGVMERVSALDTVSINYAYSVSSQIGAESIRTHGVRGAWARVLSPSWYSNMSGGVQILEAQRDDKGAVLIKGGQVAPSASVSLLYQGRLDPLIFGRSEGMAPLFPSMPSSYATFPSTAPGIPTAMILPGTTSFGITYSVGVYPSYGQQAGAIISHVTTMQASYGISDRIVFAGTVGYARNSSVSSGTGTIKGAHFSTTSVFTTAAVSYLITSSIRAAVVHTYIDYEDSVSQETSFTRHTGAIMLSYVFGGGFDRGAALFSPAASGSGVQGGEAGAEKK